jgi:type III pantothenate kinase
MNLTIDIGNTNLTLGLFKADKLVKRDSLATKSSQYYDFFKRLFRKYTVDKVIVASVVPQATRKLEIALKKLKVKPVLILGKNLVVPVKNRYQFPQQVGQDRLVNAFACVKLYGCPGIVVDFGTAITFDVISRKKDYLGGMILPGIETSLSALKEKTALLPQVKLNQPPKELIGRNTRDSILSGVIFGFSGLTDNLIKKLKGKLGKNTLVIGTGGNIEFISSHCQEFTAVDINLTLKGLNLILSSH